MASASEDINQIHFEKELVACGFIRHQSPKPIPYDLVQIIMRYLLLAIHFEGNLMDLTFDEMLLITSWFVQVYQLENKLFNISSTLLFTYDSAATLTESQAVEAYHEAIAGHKRLFIVIETNYDQVFAMYTSRLLTKDNTGIINDRRGFLCVVRSCFSHKKPTLFRPNNENEIATYKHEKLSGPIMCAREAAHSNHSDEYEVAIWSKYQRSYVNHCREFKNLYGNKLCGGERYQTSGYKHYFKVNKLQVFEIKIDRKK